MFSTAGGGYAPDAFLKNIDAHDKAIEKIRQLPELAPPHKAPAPNDGDNIWRELAESLGGHPKPASRGHLKTGQSE
jgi:hypothetical protein